MITLPHALLAAFAALVLATVGSIAYLRWDKRAPANQPLTDPPATPVARATDRRVEAMLNYYKADARRCPVAKIDPEMERQYPQTRQVLAILKYVLDQDDIDNQPSTATFNKQPPEYPLDVKYEESRRYRLRRLLDDPALEFVYRDVTSLDQDIKQLLKGDSVAAAQTQSASRIRFTRYAGGVSPGKKGDPPLLQPWRHPFRLAHTILHELVHVDQVRKEGASADHGGPEKETPPYAWEHSMDEELKSLFHPDTLAKLQPLCGGATPPAQPTPPADKRVQLPSATPAADCNAKIAESVQKAIPGLPFYAQSKAAGQPLTAPLKSSYGVEPAPGAVTANTGPKQHPVYSAGWDIKTECRAPRTAQQQQAAFAAVKDPCGAPGRTTIVTGVFGPNSCLGTNSGPGAIDINFSGDPYTGSGTVFIVTACANIWVQTNVALYADHTHGARNKPEVIAAMKADGEKWARQTAPKLLAAVNQACGQTPA